MLEQPHFGRRLKELRLQRGLSQSALAGDEMSTGYVSRLESGTRQPTERVVSHLAKTLDASPAVFEQPVAPPLAHAIASAVSCPLGGSTSELAAAIDADSGSSPTLRWQALWQLADMHGEPDESGRADDPDVTRDLSNRLAELVELGDRMAQPELRTRARARLARHLRHTGDNQQALRYAVEADELAVRHTLPTTDAMDALLVRVAAEAEAGLLAEACVCAERLLTLAKGAPAPLVARALWAVGTVRARKGDHTTARLLLDDAISTLDGRDGIVLWIRLRLALASLCLQQPVPDARTARERLAEAEPIIKVLGAPRHHQEAQSLQAHIAFTEGRLDDARLLCREVLADTPRLAFRDRVRLHALFHQVQIRQGETEPGIDGLRTLAAEAQGSGNMDLAAAIWQALAEALADSRPDPDAVSANS
ncbi:helix-turn-helix domain-containing protein [Streptomyces lincolnensis]|uniref:helix-turn-helix domain-containing protein n=1 Tax=Streptomyces lincolnensis TaxID=1915 RepID=UPI0037D1695F